MLTSDGLLDTETAHRVANASSAFARLHQAKVWSSKALSLSTKLQFLQTIVMTVLLYGGETWSLLDKHPNQQSVFHMRCSRRICGISLLDHITNPVILKRCETLSVDSQLRSKSTASGWVYRQLLLAGSLRLNFSCELPAEHL